MKDSAAVLASLKPFQRRTVEYVYRRMYEDADPAMKFLIADEVGLGKTLVAKGIIALAIEKMQRDCQWLWGGVYHPWLGRGYH
ncbi:MAG: hypothetical protein KAR40_18545 [Candidatus Sabulitectum sp.]|nr:hypothetical protein [Candidatus Sabulitectum sp.]